MFANFHPVLDEFECIKWEFMVLYPLFVYFMYQVYVHALKSLSSLIKDTL